jgi:predicted metal-dependent peptidase
MIYQPYDLRDYIAEHKPEGLTDLSKWKDIDPAVKAEIIVMTRSIVTGGKNYLANKIPFAASFGMNVNTHITFELEAPMAVNVAMSAAALTPRLNLFVNPFWLLYKQAQFGDDFIDGESFEDVSAILLHEYDHLLYDHIAKFKFYSQRGLHKAVNIATDCQINQDELIARNKNLTAYGVTLKSVEQMTSTQLKPKESSIYYFEALMKHIKDNQNGQSQSVCQTCQGSGKQQQQGQGQCQQGQQGGQQQQAGGSQGGQSQSGQQGQSGSASGQGQGQGQQGQSQGQGSGGAGQQQHNHNQGGQGGGQGGQQQGQSGQQDQGNGQGQGNQQQQAGGNQDQQDQGNGQGQDQGQQQDHGHGGDQPCPDCGGKGHTDPYGQAASHAAWNQTPKDVAEEAGGEMASADAAEQALADAVQNAVEVSGESIESLKSRGLVAGNILDRILRGGGEPGKLPIRSVLMKGAGRLKMGEKKTYRKINPHQGNRVDIRRGKVQENGKNIRVFLDNSGSMGASEINWAMNEIAAVAKKAKARLEVIPFDTVVYHKNKQYAEKSGKWSFQPVGRGGTSFQPVFDYLHNETTANNRDDLIIVITDGYGESRVDTYGLRNVIWLLVEEKSNTLSVQDPVGQIAWLDQDNKYRLHKLSQQ